MPSLSPAVVAALLLGGLVLAAYRWVIQPLFLSPLARIPSAHWSAPLSPLWILRVRYTHAENRTLLAAHRALGPVVRVGPADVSVGDADGVRAVYSSHSQGGGGGGGGGAGLEKHRWYDVFDNYGVPCMFSARSGAEHAARRRLVSHVYSKSFVHASPAASAQARLVLFHRLLPILAFSTCPHRAPQGVEVHSLYLAATMDMVAAYVFGLAAASTPSFLLDGGFRDHWLALYRSRHDHPFFPQELPGLTAALRRWLRLSPYPAWVDAANAELEAWCAGLCERSTAQLRLSNDPVASTTKQQNGQQHPSPPPTPPPPSILPAADEPVVLRALLGGLSKERTLHGASSILASTALAHHDRSVASELVDHVLAGQETAGVALTYATWRLSRDPALQRRLRAELVDGLSGAPTLEVDVAAYAVPVNASRVWADNGGPADVGEKAGAGVEREQLPNPPPDLPPARLLDSLPLLHAVVVETLRLHAPLPGPQPRVTPAGGVHIVSSSSSSSSPSSVFVPGGVRIAGLAYALHRDEAAFPACEEWRPERWLVAEGDEEEATTRASRKDMMRNFWAFGSGGRMCIGSNFAMHEMKLILATVYSNFTTHIVDDEGIEQADGYTARPVSDRLWIRLERVKG